VRLAIAAQSINSTQNSPFFYLVRIMKGMRPSIFDIMKEGRHLYRITLLNRRKLGSELCLEKMSFKSFLIDGEGSAIRERHCSRVIISISLTLGDDG
jgi:hypothetical protein